MKSRILPIGITLAFCCSCATTRSERYFMFGAGLGGAVGGGAGASLSPNRESRPWNALIFGLTGALVGGLFGLWRASHDAPHSDSKEDLQSREQKNQGTQFFEVPASQLSTGLPPFLKDRVSNLVIEKIPLPDQVSEDGSIHEPHMSYRIKQAPELLPKAAPETAEQKEPQK